MFKKWAKAPADKSTTQHLHLSLWEQLWAGRLQEPESWSEVWVCTWWDLTGLFLVGSLGEYACPLQDQIPRQSKPAHDNS